MTMPGKMLWSMVVLAVAALPATSSAAVDVSSYPGLTDKEMGQVRHLVALSNNLPGDWSGFGGNGEWEATEHHLQFQLAFSTLSLALAQQQYTPAYRELYKKAIESYIKKLTHSDIWERWGSMSSRGGSFSGSMHDMDAGWIDPLAKDNNMYKGYLALSAALHEMLYADAIYQQPGAFTFKHETFAFSNGVIEFRYTLDDVVKSLHHGVLESNYVGAACEPGDYYWSCNGASNAVFILYDHVHGTHYAEVVPKVKEAWIGRGALDPNTYTLGAMIETTRQDRTQFVMARPATTPFSASYAGSWAGIFNNAWDSEFVKAAYYGPDGLDRNEALKYYVSGDWARRNVDLTQYSARWQPVVRSFASNEAKSLTIKSIFWGFFLNYAAEVGDKQAAEEMLDYAERNFGPVWNNGEYYYPRSDDTSVDARGNAHFVVGWTGNSFLTLGRLNKGDGVRKLLEQPWTDAERNAPEIIEIDATTTNVSQAWWDATKRMLIVTLLPGPVKAAQTRFNVIRLDAGRRYDVTIDGESIGDITHGGSLAKGRIRWNQDKLEISTPIATRHSFVITQR